jgi:hypothetical protein
MADIAATCEIAAKLESAKTSDGNRFVYMLIVRDPSNTDIWNEMTNPFETVKQLTW